MSLAELTSLTLPETIVLSESLESNGTQSKGKFSNEITNRLGSFNKRKSRILLIYSIRLYSLLSKSFPGLFPFSHSNLKYVKIKEFKINIGTTQSWKFHFFNVFEGSALIKKTRFNELEAGSFASSMVDFLCAEAQTSIF